MDSDRGGKGRASDDADDLKLHHAGRIDTISQSCNRFHDRDVETATLLSTLQNHRVFSSEDLRPLLRNVRFVRQNRTVFKSTVFLGASDADFHGKSACF